MFEVNILPFLQFLKSRSLTPFYTNSSLSSFFISCTDHWPSSFSCQFNIFPSCSISSMAALQLNHQFQFLKFGSNILHCSISRGEIRDGREPDQEIPSSWRSILCTHGWSKTDCVRLKSIIYIGFGYFWCLHPRILRAFPSMNAPFAHYIPYRIKSWWSRCECGRM